MEDNRIKITEEGPTRRLQPIPISGESGDKGDHEKRPINIADAMAALMAYPNEDEVMPFKLGLPILAMAAAVPGYLINKTFRETLVLGRTARIASYFAGMSIPAFFAGSLHYSLIIEKILKKEDKCPICLQLSSGATQLITGMGYPILLVPIINLGICRAIKVYKIPKGYKEPRKLLAFIGESFTPKLIRQLFYFGLFQFALSIGITYSEQRCFRNNLSPIISGERQLVVKPKNLRNPNYYKNL